MDSEESQEQDLSGDCMHTNISEASLGECRNIDESFWNNTDAPVRLYYGPSWASPWICFDAGFRTNDLSGYWFNSGGGASLYGAGPGRAGCATRGCLGGCGF